MSAPLTSLLRRLRRKQAAILLAWLMPIWLVVLLIARELLAAQAVVVISAVTALLAVAACWHALQRMDLNWLVRRLDAGHAVLQDSSGLLLQPAAELGALQRLQRGRVTDQLRQLDAEASQLAIPRRRIVLSCIAALLAGLFAWLHSMPPQPSAPDLATTGRLSSSAGIASGAIRITPPVYTDKPVRRVAGLDAQTEQGATLHWTLQLQESADTVALHFHDGMRVQLQGRGRDWQGEGVREQAGLYRMAQDGVVDEQQPRHRIDVLLDQAPRIDVLQPEQTLTLMAGDQWTQQLDFQVSDDYGIDAVSVHVTHAHGSGENVQFREERISLEPVRESREGDRVVAHYNHLLALEGLGVEPGDDVVVRIVATDNRLPQANISRSASHILRWSMRAALAMDSLEGTLQPVLPAYFRSQRQIIIDTEQLIEESEALGADELLARSDSIGVDQRILRLRYGQFLGEETDVGDHGPGHDEGDDEHGAVATFDRDADALLEAYGHSHDDRDAATLFDPVTRETLRSALNAMWDAERHLRSGEPQAALPHEYLALENIKKVQEASRIYLERSGLETTPLNPERRLTGERDDLQPREQQLAPLDDDAAISAAWSAVAANSQPDWSTLEQWLRQTQQDDATEEGLLAILQAMDALRADPQCAPCRQQLLAGLWSRLPIPPAGLHPRASVPAYTEAWLQAVEDDRE